MNRGDTIALGIDSLAFGGDRVARHEGRVVFVDGGAPGDVVEAKATSVKARFARATMLRVLSAGPARTEPRCPLVARCGGCQWQEVDPAAQRAAKQAIVERALGALGFEVAPIIAATAPFGYRSRARFSVGDDGAIGYAARRTHEIVDVSACPLLEPALDEALGAIRAALKGRPLRAGAAISLLAGRGGRVQVAIEDAGVHGAALLALAGTGVVAGVSVDHTHAGEPLIDTADEGQAPFRGAATGFAQASHAGNRVLRRLVHEAITVGGAPARVLELHAGDGNFTRDLARHASVLVAVEGDRAAASRLAGNAGAARIEVRMESAGDAVRRLVAEQARFDAVLLDPPRAGAAELAALLPSLAPRVVYVSCDPMTLARDAALLIAAGLLPTLATPLDLMPHTFHVETVCRFERGP